MFKTTRGYDYWIVDVFSAERFGGNQLAVITDARGLESAEMQQIAREFNFSETTFVLPPQSAEHSAHFRIFTPARELPFAGHPTVGTAWVLAQERRLSSPAQLSLEAGVGLLKVEVESSKACFEVAQAPSFEPLDIELQSLAELLDLSPEELAAPTVASCGLPFALIPVKSLQAIARARLKAPLDAEIFRRCPALKEVYLYCFETHNPACQVHTRMFAPGAGVAEDPATGSAASALAAWLATEQKTEQEAEGKYEYLIEQGLEMGRPSLIQTRVLKSSAGLRVFVSGQVVPFSRGKLFVDENN